MTNSNTLLSLADAGDELLDFAVRQDDGLRKRAADIAQAIIASDDPAEAMFEFMQRQHDRSVSLKRDGAKQQATNLGRAWNRVKSALGYHFKAADLAATWPAWTSKSLDKTAFCLVPTSVARESAKETRALNQEAEQRAIARDAERRQSDEISRLQSLSIEQLSDELMTAIRVSGLDPASVLARMNEKLAGEANAIEKRRL